jgi:hypothetical protein
MKNSDQRIYRTFEEFEREELRRMDAVGSSVDDMIETIFGEELEAQGSGGRRKSAWDDDEE